MATLFVPKSRKVKFEATCVFEDLTNLPYVSGLYFIKWKIKNGSSGTSAKSTVKDHVVTWQSQFRTDVTMVIGKDGVLQPCELVILVKQVVNAGKSSEDVGMVSINLAEFAASPSSSRRYLLQESRVNSILRLTVNMKLLKGDPSYKVPEPAKRDLTVEGLNGVFSSRSSTSSADLCLNSLSDDTVKAGLTRVHPMLSSPADDPNVHLVDQLFATSTITAKRATAPTTSIAATHTTSIGTTRIATRP